MDNQQECILLVDDDDADIYYYKRLLKKLEFGGRVMAVIEGEAAINYLLGKKGYEDRDEFPFPQLIILDINLPRYNGFAVLDEIKGQLGNLSPAIYMASTSVNPDDRVRAEDNEMVSGFLSKPVSKEKLTELIAKISS